MEQNIFEITKATVIADAHLTKKKISHLDLVKSISIQKFRVHFRTKLIHNLFE